MHLRAFTPCSLALRRLLLSCVSVAVAFWFYAGQLPDACGAAFCTRHMGFDPQAYGAHFSKQWLLNGTFWWNAHIYRYTMSPADYARLRADLLAEGWSFHRDGDGLIGTLVAQHYPVDCIRDELEVGTSPVLGEYSYSITYSYTAETLYIEQHFGS